MTLRVLFVCTGNICRSPTAEAVFRHLAAEMGIGHLIEAASAGTHGYHVGDAPDPRTIDAAKRRGIDMSLQRARRVRKEDFQSFDLILAMDEDHFTHLQAMRPVNARAELKLYLEYHPKGSSPGGVPDPYYGDAKGFEHVLDLVEETSRALLSGLGGRLKT